MISPRQLFCLLLLSRLSAEMAVPHGGGYGIQPIAAAAASELLCFVFALPVIIYSARGRSLYSHICGKSRAAGIAAGLIAALFSVFIALRTCIYTAEYAQRGLVVGMSGAVLALITAAFAVYAAYKGIEAVARTSLLLLCGAAVVTLAVVLADIPYMRLSYVMQQGYVEQFFPLVLQRLLNCGEYLIFAALLPYVRKHEKGFGACGAVLLYAVSGFAATVLINVFTAAVLGEFCAVTEYPAAAASGLADITLFKRLDGFFCAIWAACSALRCALLVFAAYAVVSSIFCPVRDTQRLKGENA